MNDYMISITTPKNHVLWKRLNTRRDTAFIQLIDFPTLEDARELERSDILRKIIKILFPIAEEKYVYGKVYKKDDYFMNNYDVGKYGTNENPINNIILNTYIMRDSNGKIRIVKDTGLSIHKLILKRVIKISVYDRMEDVRRSNSSKESNIAIDQLVYDKKIWGNIMCVREMSDGESLNVQDVVSRSIGLNTSDISSCDLGFLIEYHDCKTSTIEYVENFFNSLQKIYHGSVMISGENHIFEVIKTENVTALSSLDKFEIENLILN